MVSKVDRQTQSIYLSSTYRCNKNDRFAENRKKSVNDWLCLRKGFQATLSPASLFKVKLSKNYQSVMVFVSNCDWSNLLSYISFSDLITNCI